MAVSLWVLQDDENLMSPSGDKQLSPIGEAFLAGVLHNLPALLCFTAPLPNSYKWAASLHFCSSLFALC